jgi:undecaprenyl-diphosphatase
VSAASAATSIRASLPGIGEDAYRDPVRRRKAGRQSSGEIRGDRYSAAAVDAFQAIVLGIVQGLTEFIPVSSTAHLRIVPAFCGWEDPGSAFTAVVQLGTMAAVLIYFREDLWRILRTWFLSLRRPELRSELDARMGWYIGVGTIPIAVLGFAFRHQIESGGRNLYVIGCALIALGFVLLYAERVGTRRRGLETIGPRDATMIGVAQAAALVPGVSRSGSTISAGLFRGFDRESAARYSFLLSVPAVVLSGLFEARKIGGHGSAALAPTLIATLLAFVVGYLSIAWLLRYLVSHSTAIFVAYRVGLGTLVLVLTASGAIS